MKYIATNFFIKLIFFLVILDTGLQKQVIAQTIPINTPDWFPTAYNPAFVGSSGEARLLGITSFTAFKKGNSGVHQVGNVSFDNVILNKNKDVNYGGWGAFISQEIFNWNEYTQKNTQFMIQGAKKIRLNSKTNILTRNKPKSVKTSKKGNPQYLSIGLSGGFSNFTQQVPNLTFSSQYNNINNDINNNTFGNLNNGTQNVNSFFIDGGLLYHSPQFFFGVSKTLIVPKYENNTGGYEYFPHRLSIQTGGFIFLGNRLLSCPGKLYEARNPQNKERLLFTLFVDWFSHYQFVFGKVNNTLLNGNIELWMNTSKEGDNLMMFGLRGRSAVSLKDDNVTQIIPQFGFSSDNFEIKCGYSIPLPTKNNIINTVIYNKFDLCIIFKTNSKKTNKNKKAPNFICPI